MVEVARRDAVRLLGGLDPGAGRFGTTLAFHRGGRVRPRRARKDVWRPSRGIASGSSGASCPSSSDARTTRSTVSSSKALPDALPDFFPNDDVTKMPRFDVNPLVLTALRAKRILPLSLAKMDTLHVSAFDLASTRAMMARASASENSAIRAFAPC